MTPTAVLARVRPQRYWLRRGLTLSGMAKKLRRQGDGTRGGKSGQWRGQPKKKPDLDVRIPVDPTRAVLPIPGLKAGKRRT